MKRLPILAIVLTASCATPDVSPEIKAFADASGAIYQETQGLITRDVANETRNRRNSAISANSVFYELSNACQVSFLFGPTKERAVTGESELDCDLRLADRKTHVPTTAQNAKKVLLLLSEYAAALEDLSSSTLPSQIQTSTASLIAQAGKLATATSGTPSKGWVFNNADKISGLTGFALRQNKARVLRRTVQDMNDPFREAIDTIIAYLVAGKHEPMWGAVEHVRETHALMVKNPGSTARVNNYEAAVRAYQKAYKTSPSIRLLQVLSIHDALAARLAKPASSKEILALLEELNELKTLFEI